MISLSTSLTSGASISMSEFFILDLVNNPTGFNQEGERIKNWPSRLVAWSQHLAESPVWPSRRLKQNKQCTVIHRSSVVCSRPDSLFGKELHSALTRLSRNQSSSILNRIHLCRRPCTTKTFHKHIRMSLLLHFQVAKKRPMVAYS